MEAVVKTKDGSLAFTLIELLVVMGILAVAAGVIAASLGAGIRAWESARDYHAVEARAELGLQVVENDVMNSFEFFDIPFEGNETEFRFPALVMTPRHDVPRIGTVSVAFDVQKRSLLRREWPYAEGRESGSRPEALVADVAGARFSYAVGGDTLEWQPLTTNRPVAVRVELRLDNTGQEVSLARTIVLKTGGAR